VERLKNLADEGWRVPPARPAFPDQPGTRMATQDDVLDVRDFLSINVGDSIAPAGLYASDHDMFAFLIYEKNRIKDNSESGLSRGVFFENSEVGGRALKCTTFLYRHVCGNHILWDSTNVTKLKIRHVGRARKRLSDFVIDLKRYSNASAKSDEQRIQRAMRKRIGVDKEEVLNRVFKKLHNFISLEQLDEAFEVAVVNSDVDGDPHTSWGISQGITRLSQKTQFADERAQLDKVAGKVLRIAF
jgi:hypothetical protein